MILSLRINTKRNLPRDQQCITAFNPGRFMFSDTIYFMIPISLAWVHLVDLISKNHHHDVLSSCGTVLKLDVLDLYGFIHIGF